MLLTAKYHPEISLLLIPITRPTPFTSRRDKRETTSPGARPSSQTIIYMATREWRKDYKWDTTKKHQTGSIYRTTQVHIHQVYEEKRFQKDNLVSHKDYSKSQA